MAYMWMYCMCVYLRTAPGVTKVVKSVFLLPYIGSSNYETTLNKKKGIIKWDIKKKEDRYIRG